MSRIVEKTGAYVNRQVSTRRRSGKKTIVARMEREGNPGDCPASIDQVTLTPMEKAKVLGAIKKRVTVQKGNRAEVANLPFAPGSEVEVIVVGPEQRKSKEPRKTIYEYTASLVRKKRIPRYSMKQIEEIIHQSRTRCATSSHSQV